MESGFDWTVIAAAVFGLIVLYLISRVFYKPLKLFFRVLLQIVTGGVAIFLFNLIGAVWGLTLGLNIISALIIGVMGLPGLGMLIALQYIVG